MFYLKLYLDLFKKFFVLRALSLVLPLMIFNFFLYYKTESTPNLLPSFQVVAPTSFDSKVLKQKLINLPGIERIDFSNAEAIKDGLKSLLGSVEMNDTEIESLVDYFGFEVFFSPKLGSDSQSMLQSYIKRLTRNEAEIGNIRWPEKITEFSLGNFLVQNKMNLSYGFLTLFIIVLGFFLVRSESNTFFVIRHYAKRTYPGIKIHILHSLSFLMLLALSYGLAVAAFQMKPHHLPLQYFGIAFGIFLFMGLLMNSSKLSWKRF
ncbi:MAG: hypothetical protein ACPGJV_03225 [Bacteriovoracaceae bacterium]